MRMIEHKDNAAWWMAKEGHATAEQIARFARIRAALAATLRELRG